MSLRLQNNGGYFSSLPAAWDATKDHTVLIKIKPGTNGNVDTVLRILSANRQNGVIFVCGGGAATGGANTDLFATVGLGATTGWGNSANYNARDLASFGSMSSSDFDTFILVVRGTSAGDYTGSGGAEQVESCYKNGSAGSVLDGVGSSIVIGDTGGRINYGHRDGSTTVYFDGRQADIAVWEDWRPSADDIANLSAGWDPRNVNTPKLWLYRSFRSGTTAEVGDNTLTSVGTAPTIDSADNPALTAPTLTIGDAAQAQDAEAVTLDMGTPAMVIGDSAQAQTAEAVTLDELSPVVGEPSEDAEIGNAGASTVTPTGAGAYTVRLAPDDQADIGGGAWVNIALPVTVRANTAVKTETNLASHQAGMVGPNSGWVYRLRSEAGPGGFKVAANRALTSQFGIISADLPVDSVDRTYLVALQPVWKEADYAAWFATLRTRANVHEAASVAAARAADATLPANAHARVSPGTRTQANSVATADAYMLAVRITNSAAVPAGGKRPAMLVQGQHASEHQGDYAAHEFADWLTTTQSGAAETLRQSLLERFDFVLYNGNPLGRRYGKERWTEEAGGDEDPNRAWDDSGSSQINAVKAARAVDFASFPKLVFDFHGSVSRDTTSWQTAFMLFPNDAGGPSDPTEFRTRLTAKLTALTISDVDATSEFLQGNAYDNGAAVAETLEYGMFGPYETLGDGTMRVTYEVPNGAIREVLDEMYDAGWFGSDLVIADAAQGQTAEVVTLGVDAVQLAIGDAAQAQTAEAVTLSVGGVNLAIGDSTQGQDAGALTLSVDAVPLAIADSAQGQDAGAVALTIGGVDIAVGDAAQAQTAEAVTLTVDPLALVIADAGQAQDAEAAALTVDPLALVIGDAGQAQTADSVVLTIGGINLSIGDGLQAQGADLVALSFVPPLLAIADPVQAQTAENVTLSLRTIMDAALPAGRLIRPPQALRGRVISGPLQ